MPGVMGAMAEGRGDPRSAVVVIALLGAFATAACSPDSAPDRAAPTAPAVTVAPEPAPEAAPEPAPEPEVPEVTADSPAGTEVPADQVEELRSQGVAVYVPVTGGSAVIVDPEQGASEEMLADAREAGLARSQVSNMQVAQAFEDVGVPAFLMMYESVDGVSGYRVKPAGPVELLPGIVEFNKSAKRMPRPTKAEAMADIQPYLDQHPQFEVYDLTE